MRDSADKTAKVGDAALQVGLIWPRVDVCRNPVKPKEDDALENARCPSLRAVEDDAWSGRQLLGEWRVDWVCVRFVATQKPTPPDTHLGQRFTGFAVACYCFAHRHVGVERRHQVERVERRWRFNRFNRCLVAERRYQHCTPQYKIKGQFVFVVLFCRWFCMNSSPSSRASKRPESLTTSPFMI